MKWEKSKREESTVHDSYFSFFPSSKPALLANTISHQLSNRGVHTLETQTHSMATGEEEDCGNQREAPRWCQLNIKWLMPRDGEMVVETPASGAMLTLLVWDFSVTHEASKSFIQDSQTQLQLCLAPFVFWSLYNQLNTHRLTLDPESLTSAI